MIGVLVNLWDCATIAKSRVDHWDMSFKEWDRDSSVNGNHYSDWDEEFGWSGVGNFYWSQHENRPA